MKTYLPQLFNKPSKKVALILSLFLVVISGVALSSPLPQERKEDDFIQTWDALSEKWIAQLDGPGWVYYAFKANLGGNPGTDPYSNWPLPTRSLDENWFYIDDSNHITKALTRRTDLESGNIWISSWEDRRLVLHYPTQNVEMFNDIYSTLKSAIDPRCDTFGGSERTVTSEVIPDGDRMLHISTVEIVYDEPRESGGPIEGTYLGMDVTCKRDSANGVMFSVEQTLFGENEERVFLALLYDFKATRVSEPPAEMLVLFDQK